MRDRNQFNIFAAATFMAILALVDTQSGVVTQTIRTVLLQDHTEILADTIVQPRTWVDRVSGAIVGFFFGIILFIFSFFFAFAIEKFAVTRWLVAGRARLACVPNVSSASINKNLHCRMVHMTGAMQVTQPATDAEVSFEPPPDRQAVALKRTVEFLQWHENCTTEKESKTYSYELKWTEHIVDSSTFQDAQSHVNPPSAIPKLVTKTFYADVNIGAYKMSTEQLEKLKRWHVCDPTPEDCAKISPLVLQPPEGYRFVGIRSGLRMTRVEGQAEGIGEEYWSGIMDKVEMLSRKFLYIENATSSVSESRTAYGSTEQSGKVGDIRISYDVVTEGPVSVIGVLQDDTFRAFNEQDAHNVSGKLPEQLILGSGGVVQPESLFDSLFGWMMESRVSTSVLLVEERPASMERMFQDEDTKFKTRLLILRVICYLLLSLSIYLFCNPIAELLSFLPFIDSFLKSLFFIAALLIGLVLWALAASIAWCIYRPEMITALIAAVATCFYASGAWIDKVPFGTLVPIAGQSSGNMDSGFMLGGSYVSDMAVGEVLYLVAVLPLCFVVYNLVEEARFRWNISQLNKDAGV